MIYLDVSYDLKDDAKKLGAKWDPEKKLWYAPDNSFKELIDTFGFKASNKKTKVKINKKQEKTQCKLKNELNKSFGLHLYIDLLPKNNKINFLNLKHHLPSDIYNSLKDMIFITNAYKCYICNTDCTNTNMFLCERFSYNYETLTQKLENIIGICLDCITTTRLKNKDLALQHLIKFNHYDEDIAKNMIVSGYNDWKKKQEITWNIDLSILEKCGIHLNDTIKNNPIETLKNNDNVKKISIKKKVSKNIECLID